MTDPTEAKRADGGPEAPSPGSIGPYRLVSKLAEGGMGDIWVAEQDYPVHRKVAIKILKAGMDTAQVVARFEAERQALAIMDHPTIAKVFDGGATPAGRPYFAMEYVRGEKITAYCDRHRLPLRERLELFIQLCEGVQHAHQKGVIHRDLKPSNVLVAIQGNRPVPRIIDFGVAKAVGQPLTERTIHTQLGWLVGTLEYMSPEQAELTPLDVDTRSDVYSLGVLLYELLVGVLPFDAQQLRDSGFDEVRRIIRDGAVERPSARVLHLGPPAGELAAKRSSEPAKLSRQLRGDLDWIVLKALEKDRTRRYQTASAMAVDCQKHLSYEPVSAGPPSAAYRVSRFARRHRFGVAVAASLLVLVMAFAASMAVLAGRVSREAARANEAEIAARNEAATAKAVLEFLQNDLLAQAGPTAQASPGVNPNRDLTVRAALDRAAASIVGKFATQPLVEAAIRETIGATYVDVGMYREAQRELKLALDIRNRELGQVHADSLSTATLLGNAYRLDGNYLEAEDLLRGIVDVLSRDLGEDHTSTLTAMSGLAIAYRNSGKYRQAEELYLKVLDLRRRALGPDASELLPTMVNLGVLYHYLGRYEAAEPLLAEAASLSRRRNGAEHPTTITASNNLALAYAGAGKYEQAEQLARDVVDTARRIWGAEHPNTLISMGNLGGALRLQAKYVEAEALLQGATTALSRIQGDRNVETLRLRLKSSELYRDQAKYAEATALAEDAVAALRAVAGPDHPDTLAAVANLAEIHYRQGDHAAAAELFADVAARRRQVLGEEHPATLEALASAGGARLALGSYGEAENVLRDVVDRYDRARIDRWVRYDSMVSLGASLRAQGRYADAEPHQLAGYDGLVRLQSTIPASIREQIIRGAAGHNAQLYAAWNKPDEAERWRARAGAANDATNR